MPDILKNGLFALGLNVTRQRSAGDVLQLIRRLKPNYCGKELIRIGSDIDGGYLIPDDLAGIEYCFSPGVGISSDFERELGQRGIHCFLADPSYKPLVTGPGITFDQKYLGIFDSDLVMTLDSWKDKYLEGYSGDLLLQMDIEGGEWPVLSNISPRLLGQFRIMVIEFHWMDRLFDAFGFEVMSACLSRLLDLFHVVHIHPNNLCGSVKKGSVEIPRALEITFLRKTRADCLAPRTDFPHRLDRRNVPEFSELSLPKCWFVE